MIQFIQPYFDERELEILRNKRPPGGTTFGELLRKVEYHLPDGHFIVTDSGEEAINALVRLIKTVRGWKRPVIAIPSVICGSVYRAVKDLGEVILMDADETWNCRMDSRSSVADIILVAGLSGKRMDIPCRTRPQQVIIDDSCQCYDGISGFRRESDFGVFSFGGGKQMYAGGGGLVYSRWPELTLLKGRVGSNLQKWQLWLMASQLDKIDRINRLRTQNAKILLQRLNNIRGLKLPDANNHVFSKFVVFLDQNEEVPLVPHRSPAMQRFMRYMVENGVQVEETYIPLHVRFPREFGQLYHKDFKANELWGKAITLPCRPNLRPEEMEFIAGKVKSYPPLRGKRSSQTANEMDSNVHNRSIYENRYSEANLRPKGSEDYFGKLHEIRLGMIRELSQRGRSLDLGCGIGTYAIPLLKEGREVVGLDFNKAFLDTFMREWMSQDRDGGRAQPVLHHADACRIPEADSSFDFVFSTATLYYITRLDVALKEVARVLKREGLALLEFGNLRSLNTIEAKRVSTGVQSRHVGIGWIRRQLMEQGLEPVKWRCFQILPLYGGGSSLAAFTLTPLLRQFFSRDVNGFMLDELVSSGPFLHRFAFRHMLVVRRTDSPQPLPDAPWDLNSNAPKSVSGPAEWLRPELRERRSEAKKCAVEGDYRNAAEILVQILTNDPLDAITVCQISWLYDTPEERALVSWWQRLVRRWVARYVSEGARPEMTPEVSTDSGNVETVVSSVKREPRVSVVLPTYNQLDMLNKSVESILNQSFDDFEVIIVNDGSTDGTAEYLNGIQDLRVQIIHQENRRLPSALNAGFEVARGELLTWISSDNCCAPYYLEALVEALDAFPQAGMAYADFFFIDEEDRVVGRVSVPHYGYRSLIIRNDGNAAFMYRRTCMETVGGYDAALEGAEDWDYWLRIAKHCEFVYVPESLYYYRLHSRSMQSTQQRDVNRAAAATLRKAYDDMGGELDLEALYPGLSKCRDQRGGRFIATFDFATRLLSGARAQMGNLPAQLIAKAILMNPQWAPGYVTLAVALGLDGRWAEGSHQLEKVQTEPGSLFSDLVGRIRDGFKRKSKTALNELKLDLIRLIPQDHELFARENEARLVHSFTAQSGAGIHRSAPGWLVK